MKLTLSLKSKTRSLLLVKCIFPVFLLRFKEIPAIQKEVSRLVRIHPTSVSDLPEAIQVN